MQIRVEPERMRDIAAKQQRIINEILEVTTEIAGLGDQLSSAWEGVSSRQAINALDKILDGLKEVVEKTNESNDKIIRVAEAFENVDSGEGPIGIRKFYPGFIPMPPIIPEIILSLPGPIRIDPDRVRDIANQCGSANNKLDDNVNHFDSTIKELQSCWEGKSYLRYEEEANEAVAAFRKSQESIDAFTAKIIRAANRYEEIDNSL